MSPTETTILSVGVLAFAVLLWWRRVVSRRIVRILERMEQRIDAQYTPAQPGCLNPPHVPPMTATWPARNIEVNGFRYVLDEKEQGR